MSAKKTKATKKALSKDALNRIKGGDNSTVDVTLNKAKGSEKIAATNDQYLRG